MSRFNKWDDSARPDPDAEAGVRDDGTVITPIESVISAGDTRKLHRQADLSEQIIEERQKKAAAPVHMEGLKPLPAEIQRQLPGPGEVPVGPGALGLAPSIRRSVPAPFKRNRIEIDHHGKSWAYLKAEQVTAGDIVRDFGCVETKTPVLLREDMAGFEDVAVGVELLLTNVVGHSRKFGMTDDLLVFRVHDDS